MTTNLPTQPIDAVLLDMDGTILNSIKTAERIWSAWAQRHGVDVAAFLPTIHGVQSVETIRRLGMVGIDAEFEAATITRAEIDDVEGIEAIAGAAEFLTALTGSRWGIVTSAPRALALRRIEAAGLPTPTLLVAAEDVKNGKPRPDCFILAAERLGTTADRCLVIEDSLAGIAAAESAGAMVLVVTSTHDKLIESAHPTILDYRDLVLEQVPNGYLWIRHAAAGVTPVQQCISFLLNTAARIESSQT
ncbi:HAD-IA family hydrolase [soil metagenome]